MTSDETYIGTIQDVQGATVSVVLDEKTVSGLTFIMGRGYRIGQLGSFVRIPLGFIDLFGVVAQVGASAVPEVLKEREPYGRRWLTVQLIGEGRRFGDFQRGISQYPTIEDEAHLVTEQDLARIYGRPDSPKFVRIGSVSSAESIPALVDIDMLVNRHSAVVGATGSGKSTTVANILTSLSNGQEYPSARVILLDIHGEYQAALKDRAEIFRVNADEKRGEKQLFVPYWAMSFDELIRVTPFHDVEDVERAQLAERIKKLKKASLRKHNRDGVKIETLNVDTPIPFSIHRFWYELHRTVHSTHKAQQQAQNPKTEAIETNCEGGQILGDMMNAVSPEYLPITSTGGKDRVYQSASTLNVRRQTLAFQSVLRDTRYNFLFRPGLWCPRPTHSDLDAQPCKDLHQLLEEWIGVSKPITILDLSGVPVSILTDLIGVLIRIIFDALFWARFRPEGGRQRPLLFVLEEAHTYLNLGSQNMAAAATRRLVKEGRKYGLSAMIVSQRPSEIDSTILSQCGTIFAMRLANASDRSQVTNTASDHLGSLFDTLPTLRTGEAIIVGESVKLPIRAIIDAPEDNRRPDSDDPKVYDPEEKTGWNKPKQDEDYKKVLENWRSENAKPEGES